MRLCLNHISHNLLHFDTLLLIKHYCLLFFLLGRDEKLLFIDFTKEGQLGPLYRLNHALTLFTVPMQAKRWEWIVQCEAFSLSFF